MARPADVSFGRTKPRFAGWGSGASSFGVGLAGICTCSFGVGAGGGGTAAFGCGAGALGNSFGSTLGCTGCGCGVGSGGAILRKMRGSTFTLGGGTTRGSGRGVSNAPG